LTLLFVDDDPPVLRAMERMLRTHRQEWRCHFAGDPLDALDTLADVAPDAIVSDMLMPSLDGVEFLGEAARRWPTAARFILSGEMGAGAFVRMAGAAHQCLTKPCRGDVLLDVVRQAVVGVEATAVPAVREGLYRLNSLPVAAPRLQALRRALAGRDERARDAAAIAIVERCAGLATKLLQVATWTQVGLGPPPRHVRDAYAILGADAVSTLVEAGVVAVVPIGHTTPVQLDIWARAGRTAALAATIASVEGLDADEADRAALLALWHESAPLLLDAVAPGRYPTLPAGAEADRRTRARAERAAFGLDAATALTQMLRLWGLPDPLCRAVADVARAPVEAQLTSHGAAHLACAIGETAGGMHLSDDTIAFIDRLQAGARLPAWLAMASDRARGPVA
jgi:CheY-like chemotaxis protein